MITTIAWLLAGCTDPAPEIADPAEPLDPADPVDPIEEEEQPAVDDPTVVIVPNEVFPGRTVDLVVHGEGTAWADPVSVDLGPELVVSAVSAMSETELHVTVVVPADIDFGTRDVTVTQGAEAPLVSSVDVVPSLAFTQLYGTKAQGSLLFVFVDNLDTVPFDLTHHFVDDGYGNYEDEYTRLDVPTPAGIVAQISPYNYDSRFNMGMVIALDVDATTGPFEIQIFSGPDHTLFRSEAIDVLARTPVPLEEGVEVEGNLPALGESMLYTFGAERAIFELDSHPIGNSDDPWIQLMGPSGSFDDIIGFDRRVGVTSEGPVYAVVTDSYGFANNLDFTIVGRSAPLGTAFVDETSDPNDTMQTAQPISVPITVDGGVIETLSEDAYGEDWYRIEIGPEDADRSLAISTFGPEDEGTDTRVRVFADDGTVLVDQDGQYLALNYHETVFTQALGEGTFYVVISSSQVPYPWPATYGVALAFAAP